VSEDEQEAGLECGPIDGHEGPPKSTCTVFRETLTP